MIELTPWNTLGAEGAAGAELKAGANEGADANLNTKHKFIRKKITNQFNSNQIKFK